MLFVGCGAAFWDTTDAITARRHSLQDVADSTCANGDKQTCQGVMASVRSAAAAEDIVDLGIWQFVAGLVGIILVGFTLKATRDAVREASDATDAAREALRLTQEGQEWDLRAYIVHGDQQSGGLIEEKGRPGVGFRTTYVNAGKTPAFKVVSVGSMAVAPYPLPEASIYDRHPLDIEEGRKQAVLTVIGQGAMWTIRSPETLTFAEVFKRVQRPADFPGEKVYVFGWTEYETMGKLRTTKFCFVLDSLELRAIPSPNPLLPEMKGSVVTSYTPHDNESD